MPQQNRSPQLTNRPVQTSPDHVLWFGQRRGLFSLHSKTHRLFLTFLIAEDMLWRESGVRILSADPPYYTYVLTRACERLCARNPHRPLAISDLPEPSKHERHAMTLNTVALRMSRLGRHFSSVWRHRHIWATCLGALRRWVYDEFGAWVWFDQVSFADEQDAELVLTAIQEALALGFRISIAIPVDQMFDWAAAIPRASHSQVQFRIAVNDWYRHKSALSCGDVAIALSGTVPLLNWLHLARYKNVPSHWVCEHSTGLLVPRRAPVSPTPTSARFAQYDAQKGAWEWTLYAQQLLELLASRKRFRTLTTME